ncbi:LLM class flavin-dependent oxidoreductase [Thalassococcus lentus]|uniref:LLM class flavin-dependent oxidoreductase n=1 Tax=Thalassococcus lentus TaxID=1210524 RepID=A0ABT4XS63_9RHOB|nr:LLM class flavin-dependent oxidoreductase [Thalassococcus lentus]MDA7424794.1 LLM class flavin-dependent oxidoreductase [Thalassococcus lentus]
MEFSLFAHMDRMSPEQSHETLHAEFMSLCKIADESGMRALWTGEHHGMDFTISPNPLMELVNIANHTKNLRLGTGTIIAPFWHPIKLAGEAAAADMLTGGRIELGIARGAYSYEYERLMPGMDAWEAGQRMREIAPLLPKLWEGDCAHEGAYFSFPSATAAPKPVQDGGPPIWIAARDPSSHEFGVQNGFNIQVTPLWQGIEEIETLMGRFNDACNDYSGPRPKIMLLHHTYVGSDQADVERASQELSRFYCNFGAWFQNKRAVHQGRLDPLTQEELDANAMMAPSNMRRDLTIGTARDVIDRIKRYEDLGYDEFSFWIDSGMSFERKRASLERFVEDVMPHFQ